MKQLNFILDILQLLHKGDRDVLETLILSAISAHPDFEVKLHVALIGSTEAGKTDAGETVLDIVHTEHQYETRKVSPKALYYVAKDGASFENKIIFLDDVTENDSEILKNIANTSSEPPSFTTLINQVPTVIKFNGAPVVWTTRVELIGDQQGQADRRFYTVEVKGSADTLQHIQEMLCNCTSMTLQNLPDWIETKRLLKEIMERPGKVIVPHFDRNFDITKTGMRFLIQMIRSIAKIEGRTIATDEDIAEGIRLYKSNQTQMLKLKESARMTVQHIPTTVPGELDIDNPDGNDHTREVIFEKVHKQNPKIKMDTVVKDLELLCKMGLANFISGRYNRHFYYKPV